LVSWRPGAVLNSLFEILTAQWRSRFRRLPFSLIRPVTRPADFIEFAVVGNRLLTRWPPVSINFGRMSDSLERLYLAVIAAKDLDPATSRTARLFQRGPAKMAKKLAEEAIEVVIDAVNGNTEAVVRESADLLYNLTVLWASAGVQPEDVWREMQRREHLLGIAEKLPKMPKAMSKTMPKAAAPRVRRPIVALETRNLRKRH
jgi:phosphoribosyl-ATP pyrophosphohydrolase